jgi:aspartate beta-hydroxylase
MDLGDDATATAIVEFIRAEGAGELGHAGGRTLLEHLVGTYLIMRRWDQPAWLQYAALLHSVYGTDAYRNRLLSPARRGQVAAMAHPEAERIAYLFCVTPRRPLFAGTHRWARGLPAPAAGAEEAAEEAPDPPPTRDELDAVLLLHLANLAEQAHAGDGTPRPWLARAGELAELLEDSESVTAPLFLAQLLSFSAQDEALMRRAYLSAVRDEGHARGDGFALAAATCPVVAEPCVWLAYLSRCRGQPAVAARWAAQARRRLIGLGAAWDHRLSFEEWETLINALEQPASDDRFGVEAGIRHPRALFAALAEGPGPRPSPARTASTNGAGVVAPDASTGRRRFDRYVGALVDPDGPPSGALYPDLPSRPWYDPRAFALVDYLEANYAAVRAEILALDDGRFHRESERISRTGDWDVAFFYERGRRHDDICAACPVTTQGIDAHQTVRTMAGLIYVSRMRASTHISAHRGPTNLRLRCHLGLVVPGGDCALRVSEETRRWEEGRCLVFDDHFEHEAWNHAADDRIVLIIDLWHPALSSGEITLLEALHGYAHFHARRLGRYWAANEAARAGSSDG